MACLSASIQGAVGGELHRGALRVEGEAFIEEGRRCEPKMAGRNPIASTVDQQRAGTVKCALSVKIQDKSSERVREGGAELIRREEPLL